MGPLPALANIWWDKNNYRQQYDPQSGYYIDPRTGQPSPDVGPYGRPGIGQRVFNADRSADLIARNEQWIDQARQAHLNDNIKMEQASRYFQSLPPDVQAQYNNDPRRWLMAHPNLTFNVGDQLREATDARRLAVGLPGQNVANELNSARLTGEQIDTTRNILPLQSNVARLKLGNQQYQEEYNVPAENYRMFNESMYGLGQQSTRFATGADINEKARRQAEFELGQLGTQQSTQELQNIYANAQAQNPLGMFGPNGVNVTKGGVTWYNNPNYTSPELQDKLSMARAFGMNIGGGQQQRTSFVMQDGRVVSDPRFTPVGGTDYAVPTGAVNNGAGAGPLVNAPLYSGDFGASHVPAPQAASQAQLIGAPGITLPTSYDPVLRDKDIGFAGQGGAGSGFTGMANLANPGSPHNFLNSILGDRGLGLGSMYFGPKVEPNLPSAPAAAAGGLAAGSLIGTSNKTNDLPVVEAKTVDPQNLVNPPMQTVKDDPSKPVEEVTVGKELNRGKAKKRQRNKLIAPISPEAFYGPYDPNFGRDSGF